jgi:tetratricopeptide (TPR) repeat protein
VANRGAREGEEDNMKKALLASLFVAVLAGVAAKAVFMWQRPSPTVEPVAVSKDEPKTPNRTTPPAVVEEPATTFVVTPPAASLQPPAIQPAEAASFSPAVQTLVSRRASYAQKQAAWKQLRDAHQLDDAIAELERAAKVEPKTAEYAAALGIAYVQKLRTLQDFREQSILAIEADRSFDQALELDPTNWDARFWKATSLSYWPEGLNKSDEVIENFVTLVEQQEKQPPQPQFAETYVRLGDQYQKAGYADYARETWQRGAALFPGDAALREKLASRR